MRVERVHLGDQAVLDRQDVQGDQPEFGLPVLAEVERGRRLPVGGGGNSTQVALAAVLEEVPVERPDELLAVPPHREGRHGLPHVFGEERAERGGVGGLRRRDVPAQQITLGVGDLACPCPLGRPFGQLRPHRGPRALQQAVGGGLAEVQQLGDLPGRPGHGVAQDQHRPLARGQVLDGREVCQLDRLARLDHGRRLVVRRSRQLQQPVGVRLEPGQFDRRREVGVQHLFRRTDVGRHDPLRTARQRVEAGVRRDAVEPGPEQRPSLERGTRLPGLEVRVLDEVVGVVDRAEHPVAVDVELAAVALAQRGEGIAIAAAGRGNGRCFLARLGGSNRFRTDGHRHIRFDWRSAEQSSVNAEIGC